MADLGFEWDHWKARANEVKHGVTFVEAASAFADEYGLLVEDPDHSEDEERFVLMGRSARQRILVVVHCYRESDSVIRLISARRATASECEQYLNRRR